MSFVKKLVLMATILVMSYSFIFSNLEADAKVSESRQNQYVSPSAVQLKEDLRKVWVQHVIWTRSYMVSALAGLEDQDRVLERLLKNQEDIGNAIKPYYGEEAGNKLTALLRDHILIAGKIVDAAKRGNQADVSKFNKEWFKNADDIAEFLSSANPNWPIKDLKELLYVHLQMLSDDLMARLNKDWNASVIAFDKGEEHIIILADTLTKGILKQFPKKFQ